MSATLRTYQLDSAMLNGYINDFIESCHEKSIQTQLTYRRALKEFTIYFSNNYDFAFQLQDIEKYKDHLEQSKRLQEVSVRTYLTALRRFLDNLVENKIIDSNPAKSIKYSVPPRPNGFSFLTKKEIKKLIKSIDKKAVVGIRDTAMILTISTCALTEEELINLNILDFTYKKRNSFLQISKSKEKITLPKKTAEAINTYLSTRFESESEKPIFISYSNRSANKRMSIRGIRETIMQRLKSCKIIRDGVKLSPYILRQTGGIYLANSGYTIEELMKRMKIKWEPTAKRYFDLIHKYKM